ncbi:MAG: 50S ribosomal protein L9 [Bacillota bacterium]
MKMILIQDVKTLGKKGDVVEVSDGYGRNYLLPRGLAIEATAGALKERTQQQQRQEQKKQQELRQAKNLGEKLAGLNLTIATRAGESGKLFGSVTSKEISEQVQKAAGIVLDKRKIELKEPIKAVGNHTVAIKLHPELAPVQLIIRVIGDTKERG